MTKYMPTLTFILFALFTTIFLHNCENSESSVVNTNVQVKSNIPIWFDEFDNEGAPDSTKWSYDIGDGCPNICGWGNNEHQYYTDRFENVRVKDGHLIIETHKEDFENKKYTSSRLISKNKGDWKYGRIEVRAKLPKGRGSWPAIWMLPTDWEYGGWPASGEIDIMEHVGYNPDTVFGTVHTQSFNHILGTHVGDKLYIPDSEDKFHVYAVEWTNEKLDFFIDQKKYFTFKNEGKTYAEFPFDKKFHLIMNIAVGGNWGGKLGIDDSIFPIKMEVDYVRVYDLNQLENRTFITQK